LHSGLIGLLGYLFIGLFLAPAGAQTMSNKDYIIQMDGFNTSSGLSQGSDLKINSDIGNLNSNTSEGVNYQVKTGFENTASSLPFSIELSSDIIAFGALNPTNPIIRTADLIINSKSIHGYSVLVLENQTLGTIPDTTCDNGRCNAQSASEWINTLTYGFGYRCDNVIGTDCDIEFKNPNFYKHFPNIQNNDNLQSIMSGIDSDNKKIRVSYKVNISRNQAQGNYSTIITFIAVPNF